MIEALQDKNEVNNQMIDVTRKVRDFITRSVGQEVLAVEGLTVVGNDQIDVSRTIRSSDGCHFYKYVDTDSRREFGVLSVTTLGPLRHNMADIKLTGGWTIALSQEELSEVAFMAPEQTERTMSEHEQQLHDLLNETPGIDMPAEQIIGYDKTLWVRAKYPFEHPITLSHGRDLPPTSLFNKEVDNVSIAYIDDIKMAQLELYSYPDTVTVPLDWLDFEIKDKQRTPIWLANIIGEFVKTGQNQADIPKLIEEFNDAVEQKGVYIMSMPNVSPRQRDITKKWTLMTADYTEEGIKNYKIDEYPYNPNKAIALINRLYQDNSGQVFAIDPSTNIAYSLKKAYLSIISD